jgi:hypothetical protein
MRKISPALFWGTLLSGILALWAPSCFAEAQSPPEAKEEGGIGEWWKKLERGIVDPIKGIRYYWQEGLPIDSAQKNIRLKICGKFIADRCTFSLPSNRLRKNSILPVIARSPALGGTTRQSHSI